MKCISYFFVTFILAVPQWKIWQSFTLVPAVVPSTGSIFGFAEYLSATALLLVILTASDFRFRYRLGLTNRSLSKSSSRIGIFVGVSILLTDIWFQNGLPVPIFLVNPNNIKAALAVLFMFSIGRLITVALLSPPVLKRKNAARFYDYHYRLIHEGDADRLRIAAEELFRSINPLIAILIRSSSSRGDKRTRDFEQLAKSFIVLLGDRRFCKAVVDKAPTFAFALLQAAQSHLSKRIPVFQFAKNIGQEMIRNINSPFYQEDSFYQSGLFGYTRPATHIVFGCYELIEGCTSNGASALEIDYFEFRSFNEIQLEGFVRASTAFFEAFLKHTQGHAFHHSFAVARLLELFEHSADDIYEIDGMKNYGRETSYLRFKATLDFIRNALRLTAEHAALPQTIRLAHDRVRNDVFDDIAHLIFETILAASSVKSPIWTAWSIQHNAVWSHLFSFSNTQADKIIRHKVRRLLYNEIIRMNDFANFQGARVIGYCLHVLGLTLMDRHQGYQREFFPLHAALLKWVSLNYGRLLIEAPKVADACLMGNISFENEGYRLVQTNARETESGSRMAYLALI